MILFQRFVTGGGSEFYTSTKDKSFVTAVASWLSRAGQGAYSFSQVMITGHPTAEGSFLITCGKLFRSSFTYVHIYNNNNIELIIRE